MKNIQFILLTVIVSSCSSTKIVSSWKDPEASSEDFEKVMIAVLSTNEANRRLAEDRLVSKSEGGLLPSYRYFNDSKIIKDEGQAKAILQENDFDGVMTLRLLEIQEEENYVPGSGYNPSYASYGYWGYHTAYWDGYYEPGYYVTDKKYIVETSIFSLDENKLVWSAVTATVNPTKIQKSIDEIAYLTYKQMVRDGFINK